MTTITKKKNIADFLKTRKAKLMAVVTVMSIACVFPLSASAAAVEGGGSTVTYFQVTEAMVAPVVNAINSGLTVMMPIGITCLASFIGINVVKRVIYSFI